jgi:hypothetical protein
LQDHLVAKTPFIIFFVLHEATHYLIPLLPFGLASHLWQWDVYMSFQPPPSKTLILKMEIAMFAKLLENFQHYAQCIRKSWSHMINEDVWNFVNTFFWVLNNGRFIDKISMLGKASAELTVTANK